MTIANTTLQERIDEAIKEARKLSAEGKTTQAAEAWDEVEELFAEVSHKKQQTNFQQYCQEHPEADECRIYDV
ncbi:Calvin cycle protein CP12 [Crocosphaera sp. Alani8]|uniref:Calvin cycle protein CP12 n=1 Tax=Crocosphaera sp. Alani8 TaxID=3038952 RepID=UPI00313F098B